MIILFELDVSGFFGIIYVWNFQYLSTELKILHAIVLHFFICACLSGLKDIFPALHPNGPNLFAKTGYESARAGGAGNKASDELSSQIQL